MIPYIPERRNACLCVRCHGLMMHQKTSQCNSLKEYINPETVMSVTLYGSITSSSSEAEHPLREPHSLRILKLHFFLDMVLALFIIFQEGALSF